MECPEEEPGPGRVERDVCGGQGEEVARDKGRVLGFEEGRRRGGRAEDAVEGLFGLGLRGKRRGEEEEEARKRGERESRRVKCQCRESRREMDRAARTCDSEVSVRTPSVG